MINTFMNASVKPFPNDLFTGEIIAPAQHQQQMSHGETNKICPVGPILNIDIDTYSFYNGAHVSKKNMKNGLFIFGKIIPQKTF